MNRIFTKPTMAQRAMRQPVRYTVLGFLAFFMLLGAAEVLAVLLEMLAMWVTA